MKNNLRVWNVEESNFPTRGSFKSKAEFLIRYALLAPSSHNIQPWKFRVVGRKIEIYLDSQRKLKFSDRTNRQALISIGCSILNLTIAANRFNMGHSIEFFDESNLENAVATFDFSRKGSKLTTNTNLFDHLTQRMTNRNPHTKKLISAEILSEIVSIGSRYKLKCRIFNKNTDMRKIALITSEASKAAFDIKEFRRELSEWVISVYSDRPDGIPLHDFSVPKLLTIFAQPMIKNMSSKVQSKIDYESVRNSKYILMISSDLDTAEKWLHVGMAYQHIGLLAAKNGISLAPMAACIEHEQSRLKIARIINGDKLLMFARMGYASAPTKHSPRRGIDDVLA